MLTFRSVCDGEFHHILRETDGLSVVMFSGPDCGTCRRVEQLLPGALNGIASALFKVDVQQCMGLARQYEVFHLPALFLFADGKFHATLNSEVTPVALQQAVERALAQPAEEEP
jgi:thioredoxin 1